ncbi:hypothetical protein SNEBB_010341 [Seison nebaliae]|nr:hypothetical protein SNEBB_010341 [Seison nebaliae]
MTIKHSEYSCKYRPYHIVYSSDNEAHAVCDDSKPTKRFVDNSPLMDDYYRNKQIYGDIRPMRKNEETQTNKEKKVSHKFRNRDFKDHKLDLRQHHSNTNHNSHYNEFVGLGRKPFAVRETEYQRSYQPYQIMPCDLRRTRSEIQLSHKNNLKNTKILPKESSFKKENLLNQQKFDSEFAKNLELDISSVSSFRSPSSTKASPNAPNKTIVAPRTLKKDELKIENSRIIEKQNCEDHKDLTRSRNKILSAKYNQTHDIIGIEKNNMKKGKKTRRPHTARHYQTSYNAQYRPIWQYRYVDGEWEAFDQNKKPIWNSSKSFHSIPINDWYQEINETRKSAEKNRRLAHASYFSRNELDRLESMEEKMMEKDEIWRRFKRRLLEKNIKNATKIRRERFLEDLQKQRNMTTPPDITNNYYRTRIIDPSKKKDIKENILVCDDGVQTTQSARQHYYIPDNYSSIYESIPIRKSEIQCEPKMYKDHVWKSMDWDSTEGNSLCDGVSCCEPIHRYKTPSISPQPNHKTYVQRPNTTMTKHNFPYERDENSSNKLKRNNILTDDNNFDDNCDTASVASSLLEKAKNRRDTFWKR